jgi:hypothetical protein
MPHDAWVVIERLVRSLDRRVYTKRFDFTDADIVLTWLWAVQNRRPVSWACTPAAWPTLRARRLPSPARMSRRMAQNAPATALLQTLVDTLLRQREGAHWVMLGDGKPMTVSGHSRDAEATKGAYGLKGYKLHALTDGRGRLLAIRVTTLKA